MKYFLSIVLWTFSLLLAHSAHAESIPFLKEETNVQLVPLFADRNQRLDFEISEDRSEILLKLTVRPANCSKFSSTSTFIKIVDKKGIRIFTMPKSGISSCTGLNDPDSIRNVEIVFAPEENGVFTVAESLSFQVTMAPKKHKYSPIKIESVEVYWAPL